MSLTCSRLGVPVTVSRADVNGYRKEHRLSVEEAAREVRYRFLAEIAAAVGAEAVATGHTLDDQVETILLHIIRGTGIHGLVGLKPKSRRTLDGKQVAIIRPILGIGRNETQEYCRRHDLMPRLDSTNLSLSPLRNRVRHKLLPLLESYNPAVSESLLRTASIASDEVDFLDAELERVRDGVLERRNGTVILRKEEFDALPKSLKRHLLRAVIKDLLGTLKDIEERHVEEIIAVTGKKAGKYVNLPYGLIFAVEYGRYLLGGDTGALCPYPETTAEIKVRVSGETVIPGWRIESSVTDGGEISAADDEFTAFFDMDKTGTELFIRGRRRGDRFQPLGFDRPKRLNRFMIDLKIPQGWRERVPLVCCGQGSPTPGQIIWLAGYRIDDRFKVTCETKMVLRIEFKRV